jgi:hypothetical protein
MTDGIEVFGSIVVVTDLNIEALFTKHSQFHKAKRVEPHDCAKAIIKADLVGKHLDIEIVYQ